MNPILITILFLVLLYFICDQGKSVQEDFANYMKCNHLTVSKEYKAAFKNTELNRIPSGEWDMYHPCGYNFIEQELKKVRPKNDKQTIFGISGCDFIVSKNGLWELVSKYYGREKALTLLPNTYILYKPHEMELFKKEYSPSKMYLLKKNIQQKKGIHITNNMDDIMKGYQNNFKVVQEYVKHTYLIDGHKVNLRIYLLIICRHGKLKAYVHSIGKCIYTKKKYKGNFKSIDPEEHLTSVGLDVNMYNTMPETLEDLRVRIGKSQYDLLLNRIHRNLLYVVTAAEHKLCQLINIRNNLSFQLFGLDYIFDDQMHPLLLEMNKGPDMRGKTEIDYKNKVKVLEDTFSMVGYNKENGTSDNGYIQLM
jgi:hypothetical protein